jgi:hypothetical protein
MSQRKQYCEDLEMYTQDTDTFPMITVTTDGKGTLGIFAEKILTHEQKAQLLIDAVQTLIKGVLDEEAQIKVARILKPHEYRRINDF